MGVLKCNSFYSKSNQHSSFVIENVALLFSFSKMDAMLKQKIYVQNV